MNIPKDEYYTKTLELLEEWKAAPTEDHRLQLTESIATDEDLLIVERLIQLAIIGAHHASSTCEEHPLKEILDTCDPGEKRG